MSPNNYKIRKRRQKRCAKVRIKNNTDTINLIEQLPLQDAKDPFAYQLFYGSSFRYTTDKLSLNFVSMMLH
ncbi:hypothetical protein RIR_e2525_A0A2N1NGN9_9GLOM [Rhizophagus irregularis DAOM 181602=DAOM 197198]|nr:hypothetical protein RIR_e2525_A0A2N1NGN9_9GLOM [Rhizophagus irregularis DAOM 181602=DAOM 197198]